ncbi:MAG: hypothetical protein ACP5TY_10595, partial [Thermodesulforhabdaceae bacterium]
NDTHVRHCEPERSEGEAISFCSSLMRLPRLPYDSLAMTPTFVIANPNEVRAKQSLFVLP